MLKRFFYLAVLFVLVSCGSSTFYSEDIEGRWIKSNFSSGQQIREDLRFHDLVEETETEIVLDSLQNEIEKQIKVKKGSYTWDIYLDGVLSEEFSTKGRFSFSSEKFELILTPEGEGAEIKIYSFMLNNKGKSLDLVVLNNGKALARRFSRQ
ncbi:MAG: hypothetical protein JXR63_03115 [Spirochaetales bacterium]|nr:hypothetical protein [Spirochaetales bacterium]